ncbi:photosynthetic reaction centre, H-chain N-terminal region family protein [Escherichia coli 2-427-07_S1_C2]|uniref:YadA-like family protein n=2 Tax=Escherichia coli TaxID=562 RepID=UPI0002CA5E61|nr:YadA-like family protein [Escherichia coli]END95451.1 putative inner membrane protein [Escherichia coli P0302293.7]KDY26867.1 photosynthetic reaction centre, H-chain N-terminal region family protein [Escherichia coli 2-427-07_S1_C2]MCX0169430.1 YadA-like family protein [Escherichia coli]
MNKIFKVIWNPATGNYTVTSETAKSRGKKSGRSKLLISALVAGGMLSSFGALANAGNDNGQGVDYGSGSAGDGWVAIGKGAKANTFMNTSGSSTAVGYDAIAEGQYSSAIGSKTHAIGGASMAFGVSAISEGDRSIALGASSYSLGQYSMALGRYSKALGKLSIAMGDSSKAEGANAIALGNATKATEIMSIALGDTANASKAYSMALGASSVASEENAIALGRSSVASGTDSLAFGRQSLASAANAIAIGAETEAAENATAIGNNAKAKGTNSMAMGFGSLADKVNTIALGNGSQALADNAIAIGQGNKADGVDAIALGNGSQSRGLNTIALGTASNATGDKSLALGSNSSANGINSVALGADSIADLDNTVSVGNSSLKRKIVNVKNGAIKSDSYDAINGSQLYAISDSVAKRLGGGAAVDVDDGTVTAPTYNLKNGSKNNVGAALAVLDENTLQWDQTKGKYSAAHGTSSPTASVITDVADGTISASSKDAVNGSQLKATNDDVEANTANIATNTSNIATNTANIATNTTNITNLTDSVGDLQADALLWNETKKAFSAAHGQDTTSKITNVKDADLTADSTDAVNGSQLKTTNDAVATNTTNIANNTSNIATNTTNISNLTETVTNLGEDALKWDKDNGVFTAAHGTETTSKITNVKDGDLTTGSTDAVNGSQLKTTNDAVATNTTNIATNTTNISNLTETVTNLGEDALKWDKDNGVFTAAHGTETTSKITNVKDGDLTTGSTDAVNGSQLKTTNDAVATNTTNIATNTTNISNLTETVTNLGEDALKWDKDNGVFTAAHGNNTASKITNILDGTVTATSSDAINGSQLYDLSSNIATYFGGNASVNTDGVFTGPTYKIGETNYYNVGDALAAINSSFSTSLGDALLWDATAGKFSAKHGTNGDASVITDVADGEISDSSSDAVNGSQLHGVSSYVVDALGGGAEVNADGTITAPTYTIANADYDNVGDALNAIDTTLDDALLWDADAGENGAFSAAHGKDKTASVITNVANGAISAASSDAINGSQLYTTNKYIADALGGDAEVNADGTITAPTYTIANAEYNNVGDALDALDDNALLWDETANGGAGAYNASHDGKASIITNVANGSISEDSTDAVNGSQLNATNMMIEQNTQIINQLAGNTDATYIQENGAGINYVRTNDDGLAFNDASAQGVGATAIGYNSVAKGDSSVAIGQGSYSDVDTGIALGSSSVSSRVIAKGSRDTSITENGVVIGYDTTDGELLGALSIGDDGKYRQIINVADGSEAHDAVTVRQLQNAIGAVATTPTKYFHANSTEEDSLAVGTDSLAMGAKTIVNGDKGIGIGYGAYVDANALNGIAIGSNAQVIHVNSIAIGNGSTTTRGAQTNYTAYNMDAPQNSVGEFSVGSADGQRQITNVAAGSADTDAVNVGQLKVTDAQVSQNTQSITNLNNQVTNLDTRVTNIENGIGDIVTTGSTKYFKTNTDGVDASAQGKDSVAIGSGSIAAADNSVALGTGSVATEENTISVGSSTNQRRITNVAAGKNDTDAVNVAQLKSSEAGGVRYDTKADGSIDYSNITLGGGNGGTTRISNVSAGVNNNDAVNYAQLKQSVQETKQYTDQRMVEMDNKLSKTESKLSGGIASAMAMTGLPQAYTPGASMASIGGGTYNGESAVALGVSMVSANGRWVYKLQGSTNSQGEYSAALGAGIQW